MKTNSRFSSLLCCVAIGLASQALPGRATTTISTTPSWDGANGILYFGDSLLNDTAATMGQTFIAPATDRQLTSFTLWVQDFYPVYDNPIDFGAYLMAWDGSRATGPVLYNSGKRTTTNNHGHDGMEAFNFNVPGGVALSPGGSYVLFLCASEYFNGTSERGEVGAATSDAYGGGCFVYMWNHADFSLLTTSDWTVTPQWDLAFSMTLVPVPEPSALGLACVGLAVLLGKPRRFSCRRIFGR